MKKLIPITLILYCLFNCSATQDKKDSPDPSKDSKFTNTQTTKIKTDPTLSSSWSDYQGKMKWEDAKAKCASIGMRLPTRAELKSAYKAKVTESWGKVGLRYWSSEEFSEGPAYNFNVGFDIVYTDAKYNDINVRCIRDKKDSPDDSKSTNIQTTKIETDPTPSHGNFSAYQGKMKWHDAIGKCASLKMRLPTRDELVAVYKAGVGKEWLKDGTIYWTSEEYSAESVYYVTMNGGDVDYNFKVNYYGNHVRCIR